MNHDTNHKSGFVSIIGNPNVGKSTLMNALIGEKLSIITSKAQTTRHRILGIINGDYHQIVLSDTPGIIDPAYKMQDSMMNFVKSAFKDADILIYMVQVREKMIKDDAFQEKIRNLNIPIFLLINKIDLSNQKELEEDLVYWKGQIPNAIVFLISALNKFNIQSVLDKIVELLPSSPPFYPKEQLTDKSERFFVNEIIREKILLYYKKEIPYAVEIETETFSVKENIIHIRAIIMVERASQKGIVIGKNAVALKKVGIKSRRDLEAFFKKKIFLELYVKVNKNWRSNDRQLKRFGYKN